MKHMKTLVTSLLLFGVLAAPAAAQSSTPAGVRAIASQVRGSYGATMTKAELGEALVRIAHLAGPDWGVLLKDGGTNCPSTVGPISCDILVHIPNQQEYDMFGSIDDEQGNPGPAVVDGHPVSDKDANSPTFGQPVKCGTPNKSGCAMSRVRSVAEGITSKLDPIPQPSNQPSPLTTDLLREIIDRLIAVESELKTLRGFSVQASVESVNAATRGLEILDRLRNLQFPIYKGGFFVGTIRPCMPGTEGCK